MAYKIQHYLPFFCAKLACSVCSARHLNFSIMFCRFLNEHSFLGEVLNHWCIKQGFLDLQSYER